MTTCQPSATTDLFLRQSRVTLLPGEIVAFSGQTLHGVIVLTSYRLIILSSSGSPPSTTVPNGCAHPIVESNGLIEHSPNREDQAERHKSEESRPEWSNLTDSSINHINRSESPPSVENLTNDREQVVVENHDIGHYISDHDVTDCVNGISTELLQKCQLSQQAESRTENIELTKFERSIHNDVEDEGGGNDVVMNDSCLSSVELNTVDKCVNGNDSEKIPNGDEVNHHHPQNGSTSNGNTTESSEEDDEESSTPTCDPEESIELRDNVCLHLLTKHVKCFVCSFTSIDQSSLWHKRLNDAIVYTSKLDNTFCFRFWKQIVSCKTSSSLNGLTTSSNNNHNHPHCNGSTTNYVPNGKPALAVAVDASSLEDDGPLSVHSNHSLTNRTTTATSNGHVPNGDTTMPPITNYHTDNKLISHLINSCRILSTVNNSSTAVSSSITTTTTTTSPSPTTMTTGSENDTLMYGSSFDRTKFEFDRMNFDSSYWRISDINCDFKSFPTYPQYIIVPNNITDDELCQVASFRSFRRLPAVVWRYQKTGCVIARSSQPEVGWFGWRSTLDEKMLSEITSSSKSSKLLILDARSYAAAVANRAKGGGCECPEYYPDAEVQFMGLANIHSIRKSFQSIRYLCQFPTTDPVSWNQQIDSSKWLHHINGLIKSSLLVASTVSKEGKSVLVHCSDGWDRTPQIIALAEVLLDSFYRTIQGFQILIQREWIDFGHKFFDRIVMLDDPNERCPVFLQWIDCVHQIVEQFPNAFEFNTKFLVELVIHVHSGLFGNFTYNNMNERVMYHVNERSFSLWSLLSCSESIERFTNPSYSPSDEEELTPSCKISDMVFWNEMYLKNCSSILDE